MHRHDAQKLAKEIQENLDYLSSQVGTVYLAALCLRDNSYLDEWDFLIAAKGLNPSNLESYLKVSDFLNKIIENHEGYGLSRFVILDAEDPTAVQFMYVQHNFYEEKQENKLITLNDRLADKIFFRLKDVILLEPHSCYETHPTLVKVK